MGGAGHAKRCGGELSESARVYELNRFAPEVLLEAVIWLGINKQIHFQINDQVFQSLQTNGEQNLRSSNAGRRPGT
jgi:hypothetical protein